MVFLLLDLFGSEIFTNAADFFASGIKGRWKEAKDYEDHLVPRYEQKCILQVENGRLVETAVPMRNAMNELLREEYMKDCARVVKAWNRTFGKNGLSNKNHTAKQ